MSRQHLFVLCFPSSSSLFHPLLPSPTQLQHEQHLRQRLSAAPTVPRYVCWRGRIRETGEHAGHALTSAVLFFSLRRSRQRDTDARDSSSPSRMPDVCCTTSTIGSSKRRTNSGRWGEIRGCLGAATDPRCNRLLPRHLSAIIDQTIAVVGVRDTRGQTPAAEAGADVDGR